MKKTIILISGKLRSGKNELAKYLEAELEAKNNTVAQDFFAKTLKESSYEDFKALQDEINKKIDFIKNKYCESKPGLTAALDQFKFERANYFENKTFITRHLLQIYGNDIFRKRVDEFYWVKSLADRVATTKAEFTLVTDLRYENEIELVRDKLEAFDLITIRVNRDIERTENMTHASEIALDDYQGWSYIVDNNGTIDDLKDAANQIINDIKKESQRTFSLFGFLSK